MTKENRSRVLPADELDDISLIARMRVVLAITALMTVTIDPIGLGTPEPFTLLVFGAYTAQSFLLYAFSERARPLGQTRLVHWIDVIWFTLILILTGPSNSFFFLFFFAILTSAFRWGFDEGARVTLASALLFCLSGLRSADDAALARLLLRTAFLLGLGYMVVHWAQASIDQRRRMALLRDVSRLSNPRFGVDQTIASVMEHVRTFFGAASCMVVMREDGDQAWTLRTASGPDSRPAHAVGLHDDEAAPLVAMPLRESAVFARVLSPLLPWTGQFRTRENAKARWQDAPLAAGMQLADLLDAGSFIWAPIPLRQGEGRIYVTAPGNAFDKDDAMFLAQVAAQAFPVIENIRLLDRLASNAARNERQKIAHDLHDTAVQPYIGLSLALNAMLDKADDGNPLAPELRQVADMACQFVADLRRYAGGVRHEQDDSAEPAFLLALRAYAANVKKFYDLDIALPDQHGLPINDRLGAEVFQIVSEAVSNIRRHTCASKGAVAMRCAQGWLHITIGNECTGEPAAPFMPRSISERAAALGGHTYVARGVDGSTCVHIDIPV